MTRPTRLIRAAPRPSAGGLDFDDEDTGISATTVQDAINAGLAVVIAQLVNKSGGSLAAGDVVIVDTGNDTAVETTTAARSETTVGVVQATIADNATGPVLLAGIAALVNVPASVTRGHYIETHTVAKQAVGNSTRRSGSFGQFLTGGTTPSAVLWGQTDQTASGGGSTVDIEDEGSPEGAADTIDFVGAGVSVTFSGGVATVDIPGGGGSTDDPVFDLFGAPDTAFEFDTSSLSGLTAFGTPDVEDADTTIPDAYYLEDNASSSAWVGRYLASPSMPFTAIAKTLDGNWQGNFNHSGLIVGAASMAGAFVTLGAAYNSGRLYTGDRWTNLTNYNASINTTQMLEVPFYMAIVANSSTDLDLIYSFNGWVWNSLATAYNPSLTVGAVAIGMASQNAGGMGIAYDYLRIWNTALTFPGAVA